MTRSENPELEAAREELDRLRSVDLPTALAALEEANRQGDASQNPDSFLAAEHISRINGRIAYLQELLSQPADHPLPAGTVVVLDFGDGPEEHVMSPTPGQREGRVAITFRSPLGAALADAGPGDTLLLGRATVTVVSVRTP